MPRTHRHFPGRYPFSNRYFVNRSRWLLSKNLFIIFQEQKQPPRQFSKISVLFFQEQHFYNFPARSLYFFIEQILFFQEALSSPRTPTIFQETLSSPRTHTIFQEPPMARTHRYFPGRYPLSNRYFANRSRWLLSFCFKSF